MQNQKWDDKYATGIDKIDDDHKQLIMVINKIFRMIVSGKYDFSDYNEVLNSLGSYVTAHFEYEEVWMLENSYPNRDEHILDHQRFSKKISALDRGHLTIDILSFLKVWLLTHIAVVDSDLGAFRHERAQRGKVIGQ